MHATNKFNLNDSLSYLLSCFNLEHIARKAMPLSRKTSPQAQQLIQKAFKELEQAVAVPHAIQFHNTSIEDVRKACETLENELGARGLLRNMRRLEPLLKGLDCYSKAVDTLCQGTPFLPWIWAPIVVILKVSCADLLMTILFFLTIAKPPLFSVMVVVIQSVK